MAWKDGKFQLQLHMERGELHLNKALTKLSEQNQIAVQFTDNLGAVASKYPLNPNGSPEGVTGFTSRDGRVTIMMPHPERVFRSQQLSWKPSNGKNIPHGCKYL